MAIPGFVSAEFGSAYPRGDKLTRIWWAARRLFRTEAQAEVGKD